MKNKLYSISFLLGRMKENGLPGSRMWLRWAEDKENLVCPRLPGSRGDRAFTQSQIEEIIEAFSPGGRGYWIYQGKKNDSASSS